MYSRLPWELRNHVHTFCVQGAYDNEVVVRQSTGSKLALLVRQPTDEHSYQWVEDPILQLLNPRRIGRSGASEVLDAYYRTRTFTFAHRELGGLRAFLENDSFGLGVRPADNVRRMHLEIQPLLYAQVQSSISKEENITGCCRALEALATIQGSRTTVVVHINLAQGFLDDEEHGQRLADAAEFVFRTSAVINTLRLVGLTIELVFEGRWDESCGLQLCDELVSSLDHCRTQIEIACA